MKKILGALLVAGVASSAGWVEVRAETAVQPVVAEDPVVARTTGFAVLNSEFNQALRGAVREKFYHGQVPEVEYRKLEREVILNLVDRRLMLQEALRLGVQDDQARVAAQLSAYEARYSASAQWPEIKANALPALTERLREDSRLAGLEESVRMAVAPPTEQELAQYYQANLDKFTEPEKIRLSVLLIAVHPSSPPAVWDKADQDAQQLLVELKTGVLSFEDAVTTRSGHPSAANKGDLGLSHRGRLPGGIEETIGDYKVGDLIGPVRLLEGSAIFKLTERVPPKRYELDAVRQRASDLWLRDRRDVAWQQFKESLRKNAKLELDAKRFPADSLQGVAGSGRK